MVRTYQRKSTYCKYNKDHILRAVKAIKLEFKPLTKVADEYGIKVSSLYYHLNRYKNFDFTTEEHIKEIKNVNQVFTKEMEYEFVEQFVEASDYCIGLGPLNVRKFAYEFAVENELDLRQSWMENEAAGEDWFVSFTKRHPIVTTMGSSDTRSIQMFFKNYQELLDKFGFQASKIFKVDEILLTTAKQQDRVFARRGKKETPEIESMKQDELTTMVSTVSASGTALPPMFLIPKTSFGSDMIDKAMAGSIKVRSKCGWMTKSDFVEYLAHFVKVAQCDKNDPCLIIVDNHACSMSLEAIACAKENGIFILIVPIHTYNKLQPLKDKLFDDLKTKVNNACEKWVAQHTKKSMKIRDIISLVEKIFPNVFTSSAIKSGFELSNIYPLNSSNYSDDSPDTSKDTIIPDDNDESIGTPENMIEPDKNNESTGTSENTIKLVENDESKGTSEIIIVPDQNAETTGTSENMIVPDQNDVNSQVIETNLVVKEELETPSEIVVYYPTDVDTSMKMPLSQIAGIVGTPLEIKKEQNETTDVEQKENIDDRRIDIVKDEIDGKETDEAVKNNSNEKKELEKEGENVLDRKKRRKHKANSKLSEYVYY